MINNDTESGPPSIDAIYRDVTEAKPIVYAKPDLSLKYVPVILDNIIDPRNLGACIRSAAVIGVDALIINKHHCTPINAIAHKVSVGGAEVIKIFHVTNLINCLKFLKESNVNIYGLSEHAKESHLECNFTNPSAIIMGAEESGIREKTLESCDFKINLSNNKLFKSF